MKLFGYNFTESDLVQPGLQVCLDAGEEIIEIAPLGSALPPNTNTVRMRTGSFRRLASMVTGPRRKAAQAPTQPEGQPGG